MQASCTYGSVRGAPSNGRSYRDMLEGLVPSFRPHRRPSLDDSHQAQCSREPTSE